MRPLTLRSRDARSAFLLALVAYVPPFFSAPGALAADTKTYLYLNPGRLLQRPVEFVRYPGGSHGVQTPSQLIDRITRSADWFERWLAAARPQSAEAAGG